MIEKIMKNDRYLFETIKKVDGVEGKEATVKDYMGVIKPLTKNLPPIAKEKHNIWVSIFPDSQMFLDVINNGNHVEKIIYFIKSGSKTELSFTAKGVLKKKETKDMRNYPRHYNAIIDEWGKNFKELNKERVIPFNGSYIKPVQKVEEYMDEKRGNRQAVMINPDIKLEDDYNSIISIFKYFWGMDIKDYVIQVNNNKTYYTFEKSDWVEIYALKSDNS